MYELTALDIEQVGGGFLPIAGVALAVTIIASSGPIYDFLSGLFDGLGGLAASH